ncbi:hypothetical protein [uncultured Phenylobacterium sp.]|uniref:hypothetical protein n=1 Tax=uncultured Phenylobacterium sp. TaxID=349273 RepID=UPI0025F12E6B|nr:hypothetical protein [uncultured Phenylobacterium sp.]
MRYAPAALLCLAALSLGACERGPQSMASNGKICIDFKQAKAPVSGAPGADGAAAVDLCVQRWAYSLASSRDDAETVAQATAIACQTQLARWNQASLNQPGADGEAASLITGQPTSPLAEHNAFSHSRALFYVVQARAGNCAPPAVVNGVPEGVS